MALAFLAVQVLANYALVVDVLVAGLAGKALASGAEGFTACLHAQVAGAGLQLIVVPLFKVAR